MYGYDVSNGLVPKDYKEFKGKQAIENGSFENLKKGKKFRFRKGQKGVGKYIRSKQTKERLRNLPQLFPKKISKEDQEKIKKLYKSKKTLKEIAKIFNVSIASVSIYGRKK